MYVYRTFCGSFKIESESAAIFTVCFGFLWLCMFCWLQKSSSKIIIHDCLQMKENHDTKKRYDLG